MTIKLRSIIAIAAVAAALAAIALGGWFSLRSAGHSFETLYADRVVPMRDLKTIADMYAVTIVDAAQKARNGEQSFAASAADIAVAQATTRQAWADYSSTRFVQGEQALAAQAQSLMQAGDALIARLVAALEGGDAAALDALVRTELYATIDPISAVLSRLVQVQLDEARRVRDDFVAQAAVFEIGYAVAALFALAALLFSGWASVAGVVRPLRAMTRAMTRLADGDKSVSIPGSGRTDEIGTMAKAVQVFKDAMIRAQALEAEQAREGRALLRAVIDSAPVDVSVADLDGRFVIANTRHAARFGYTAEAFVSQRPELVYDADYLRSTREREQEVARSGEPSGLYEVAYGDRDGQTRTLLTSKVPLRDPAGAVRYIVTVAMDITERKAAQAALAQTRTLLREVIDSVPATIAVRDRAGRYVLVNAELARFHGRSVDWFPGRSPAELYDAGEYTRLLADADRSVIESGERTDYHEVDYRDRDGQVTNWLTSRAPIHDPSGSVRYVVHVGLDITESRQARRALEEAERRLGHLLESASVVPYTWDFDGDRCLYLGPQTEALFGFPVQEVAIGSFWESRVVPEDLDRFRAAFDGFSVGTGDIEIEYRVVHADGRIIWVRHIARAAILKDGRRIRDGLVFDITESKLRDQQLAQAQKMEAVGQLTGGVAHDFNNLLAVISGSLEYLIDELSDRTALRQIATRAMAAAGRGAALTRSLLAFSRRQPLLSGAVDINRLVGDTYDLIRLTIPAGIAVKVVPGPGLWDGEVDAGQLQNALLNLVVNARDAMPKGGLLTIETSNASLTEEDAAAHVDVRPGDYVMLAISDTGTGMPPEVVARAFEPFFTTKGPGKGTGLGLSMVYGFARQYGGHLDIRSEVGVGTTIRIYLPRAAGAAAELPKPAAPARAAGGAERILLVEDDPDLQALIVIMLDRLGYKVVEARDGPAALRAIEATPEVALLLTDVVLPGGMTGPEIAERAGVLRPDLPVVFMSGYTENAILQGGRLAQGARLLHKPFTMAALAEMLRAALEAQPSIRADVEARDAQTVSSKAQ